MELIDALNQKLNNLKIYTDEPMSGHITFKAGGPADIYIEPVEEEEIRTIIRLCREYKSEYFVLGNGSNILFGDGGYRGVVISLAAYRNALEVHEEVLRSSSGYLLKEVAEAAAKASLTGMEFASGIPGSVGGAVYMNAGAYGSEMKDVLFEVKVLEADGEIHWVGADNLALGYRSSNIASLDRVVLEAKFKLSKGDDKTIYAYMEELGKRRKEKQPLEFPSSGSTFKRPEGYYAGKLIDEAGLRGYRVGDAMVSEKHCGFVINTGNASARDIYTLIEDVQRTVKEKHGVDLVPEVKLIGDFS